MADPRSLRALQQFWEALALGRPAAPGDLDPELAALIQRLHATPDVPPPDPAFAKQLREDLMHAATLPRSPGLAPPLNGRVREAVAPGAIRPATAPRRANRAWPLAQAAVILLLIAAMIAGALILRRPPAEPTFAPSVATPAAGASSDWPMFRGNPGHNSANAGPGLVGSPVTVWTYQANGPVSRGPAVADGVAYLQSGDGMVTALDAATGEVLWQNADTNVAENTPSVAGDMVYVTNVDGHLLALDRATGAEHWRFAETISAESLPTVVDGVVYVGSEGGTLYAVDAKTGAEVWQVAATGGIFRAISVSDSALYFGTMSGHLEARSAADGALRWQIAGPDPEATIGAPAVSGETVVTGYGSAVHALDAATGAEKWSIPIDGGAANSLGNGMMFSAREDGVVHAYDATSGEERWTFTTGAKVQAAPAIIGDTVYIASFDHSLYAVDAATGAEQWSFELDGQVAYGPSVAEGMLFAGTDAGTLYAIGGSGSSQLNAPLEATPSSVAAPTNPALPPDSAGAATPVEQLWQYIDPANPVYGVDSMSLGPDGSVWIIDGPNAQIRVLSPDGKMRERWGGPGSGPGQFNFSRNAQDYFGSVTVAPNGTFYVADSHNYRIQHFDAERNFLGAFGTFGKEDGQFLEPIQALIDADGNLYVIDAKRDDVQKFSPDGAFLLKFSGHGSEPGQMSNAGSGGIDSKGNIWVADGDNHRLQKFSPSGELLQTIQGESDRLASPSGFAIDSADRLWVGDFGSNQVQVYAPDGTFLLALDGTEDGGRRYDGADMLAIDDLGYVYVQEYGSTEAIRKLRLLDPLIGGIPEAAQGTPAPGQ